MANREKLNIGRGCRKASIKCAIKKSVIYKRGLHLLMSLLVMIYILLVIYASLNWSYQRRI